jgi:hypothetical protein
MKKESIKIKKLEKQEEDEHHVDELDYCNYSYLNYMSDEGELEKDHLLCGQEIKEQLK